MERYEYGRDFDECMEVLEALILLEIEAIQKELSLEKQN